MRAPPTGDQPECDHTPEKRSVTTCVRQRSHPPGRVTTFPPERRHGRRYRDHISFSSGATPGAQVRSRRRHTAQSVPPSVRLESDGRLGGAAVWIMFLSPSVSKNELSLVEVLASKLALTCR